MKCQQASINVNRCTLAFMEYKRQMHGEVCLVQTLQTAEGKAGHNHLLTRISTISPKNIRYILTMRFALFAGLASLVSSVTATALTYRLEANEKACFFTNVDQSNAKLAFYFAVSPIDYPAMLHLVQDNLQFLRIYGAL
jgi:hypothetical protein